MKKFAIPLFLVLLLTGCPPPHNTNPTKAASAPAPAVNVDYIALINSATTITVQEYTISMGKDYDILADGVKVATVSGKDVRFIAGDVFTLTTLDGKVLASEEEQKRYLLKFNRAAVVYDADKNTVGYLAEDRISSLFSLSYQFFFYDADRNEIGKSAKFTNSCLGTHTITDADGNVDYDVNKHLTLIGGDTYDISIKDPNSAINRFHVILLVCIEDAIADAQAAKD